MPKSQDSIEKAVKKINDYSLEKETPLKILALTGSGISKGSGIPTFRGKDGLWKNYNAMDLATPQAFKKDPELVWEWYTWRMNLILEKEPNAAHYALAKLQKHGLLAKLITQNVDSLHNRAGTSEPIEIHGNIFRAKCTSCDYKTTVKKPPQKPPVCPNCNSLLRPDVVWFGESLESKTIRESYNLLTNECDVLLVVGTSGIVYPVADFPAIAKSNGALVIEFNIEPTPISRVADLTILGKSEETLPEFVEGITKGKEK